MKNVNIFKSIAFVLAAALFFSFAPRAWAYYVDTRDPVTNELLQRVYHDDETDKVTRINTYVYDGTGTNTRVSYQRQDFDESETITQDRTYSYNEDGKVSNLVDSRYTDGALTITYTYSDYAYYENGTRASYTRTDTDADGNTTRSYSANYDESGSRTDYAWTTYDAETGNATRDYSVNYDASGNVSGVTDSRYDEEGNLTITYNYSDYTYYEDGTRASYTRTDTDADGNTTRDYSVNYDASGNVSGVTDSRYDEEGNLTVTYNYSDYTYYEDGTRASYTRTDTDSDGNTTRSYSANYDESGSRTDYAWTTYDVSTGNATRGYAVLYNESGQVEGVTDSRYDEDGNLNLTYNYSDYTYHDNGTRSGYTRITTDSDGAVTQELSQEYNEDGVRIGFERTDYDPLTGLVSAHYDYDYNDEGVRIGSLTEYYDSAGNKTSETTIAWNDEGVRTGYNRYLFGYDEKGDIVSVDYLEYTYDSEGNASLYSCYTIVNGVTTMTMWEGKSVAEYMENVTGYYYDPKGGRIIPRYGTLPPVG